MPTIVDDSEPNPNTPEAWHAAAARIRAANRTALAEALDDIMLTDEDHVALAMIASFDAGSVGVLTGLFDALRGVPRRLPAATQ